METTLLLVDDHAIVRSGLRLLLEKQPDLRVVGEAGDGQAAIELAQELAPDVVVMDISMPNMDGIEATRRILDESPGIKVIVLSIHGDSRYVKDMLQAGAAGYLLKESVPEELVRGIRTVSQGEVFLSSAITGVVVGQYIDLLTESPLEALESIKITKLLRPQAAQHTISRPRLLTQFEGWRQRPLTLVSAPAGYGKSTAVSQWLESCGCPNAWLSLDEGDNDLRGFLTYLVSAIQTQFPELLREMERMLATPVLPPMQVLVNTLVNELESCPQHCVLALDDYHVIVDEPVHDLLSELLKQPPRPLHLVLITRTDPSLDLPILRAYNQIGEVRARALSFTFEETETYLEQISGRKIEPAVVKALLTKTEGWVIGLRLITLSARDDFDLVNASEVLHSEVQTLDYLIAEALSRQPREVQAWLLKTSILDRFCVSLCEAVCAPPDNGGASGLDGNAFIEWLVQANLFLFSLDHRRRWFRYHRLFQELLRSQLGNTLSAVDISALHARASRWFAENGLIDDAIRYALAAEDISYVVHLVEQNRYDLMNSEQWQRLGQWLKVLPPETVEKNPMLLLAQAYLYEYRGDIVESFAFRDRAEALLSTLPLDSPERNALKGEIAVLYGEQYLLTGEVDLAMESANTALEFVPANALHIWSYAIGEQVLVHQMVGDINRGRKVVEGILKGHASLAGITEARMMLWFCLANWMEGDLDALKESALRCLQLGERHQLPESYSFGRYFLGACHYVRNELEAAEQYLAPLFDDPHTARPQYWVQGGCTLALIHHAQGRKTEAVDVVESMIVHKEETKDMLALSVVRAFRVELALLQGHTREAEAMSTQAVYDVLPAIWFRYVTQLTSAKVLLAQNRPESLMQAIAQLEQLDGFLQGIHRKTIRIDLLALQALVLDALGRKTAADHKLLESLALASPGGFIRNYVDLGQPMAILLRRLKKQGLVGDQVAYVDEIMAAFASPPSSASPAPQPDSIEALTEREMQIVRLLATELTTDEIASQIMVSVSTVRTHSKNIYSKLNAHSRIEAVVRAQELSLI